MRAYGAYIVTGLDVKSPRILAIKMVTAPDAAGKDA